MANVKEGNRQALLRATVRVVAQHGLRGLTYRAVAKEAGVAHGLVAHYFGSRDALVSAALKEASRGAEGRTQLGPGTGNLDDVGKGLSGIIAESSDEERFQYEMLLESLRRPELQPDVKELYSGYIHSLRTELEMAGVEDADTMAVVVFAALDGLVALQLLFEDAASTERAIQRLRSIIKSDVALGAVRSYLTSERPSTSPNVSTVNSAG